MAFDNGFEEDYDPVVPPRQQPLAPPPPPPPAPQAQQHSSTGHHHHHPRPQPPPRQLDTLDLTNSPPLSRPLPLPSTNSFSSSHHSQQQSRSNAAALDNWFASPAPRPPSSSSSTSSRPSSSNAQHQLPPRGTTTSAFKPAAAAMSRGPSSTSSPLGGASIAPAPSGGGGGFAKYAVPPSAMGLQRPTIITHQQSQQQPQRSSTMPVGGFASSNALAAMTGPNPTGVPPNSSYSQQQQGHGRPNLNRSSFNNGGTIQSPISTSPTTSTHPHASSSSSLGRIPIISSASAARLPSSSLASSSSSGGFIKPSSNLNPNIVGKNYYAAQSAANGVGVGRTGAGGPQRASTLPTKLSHPTSSSSSTLPPSSLSKGKAKEEILDLTTSDNDASASDSDDLIIEDTPVCIGQLTSLALILYPVSELLPDQPLSPSSHPQPQPQPPSPLPVHIFRDIPQQQNETLKLISPKRKETFGVMEHRVANVVASLIGDGYSGTGFNGRTAEQAGRDGGGVKGKVWVVASVVRRGEKNPMMLPLHLLFFARPSSIPFISHHLESHTIYLEHPRSYHPEQHGGARYSNPHNPPVGSGGQREMERRRTGFVGGMYGARGLGATQGQQRTAQEVQREQVETVFQNLKSGPDLEEVDPPPIVTTPLYPHQKQALSFLLDRESLQPIPERDIPGEEPTMISLWQRLSDTYGKPKGWKNILSGLEIEGQEGPPQARGAILADDMGLGKTIVVISLVCSTLSEATTWSRLSSGRPERTRHDARLDPSSSTSAIKASDFGSRLYGLPGGVDLPLGGMTALGAGGGKMSKKKIAAMKREAKREDAMRLREERLVKRSRATLIVCPLSTVQNWESQFEEHTARKKKGGKKMGGGKGKKVAKMVVDGESEEEEEKEEESGSEGGKEFVIKSEEESSESDSEEGEDSEDDIGGRGRSRKSRSIKIYVYHGNHRLSDPIKLADYDVVITTFSTLGTEYSKQCRAEEERMEDEERERQEEEEGVQVYGYGKDGEVLLRRDEEVVWGEDGKVVREGEGKKGRGKKGEGNKRKRKKVEGDGNSPLQQVQWFRVVLDEAHIIKEHTTIQARAACDLSTSRRIALSGTPLQNSLNDLFSLVRFLRLEPFTDRSLWNQHIGNLAKANDPLGVDRLQLIMRHLALRRTKNSVDKEGKPILSLPAVDHKLIMLKFDAGEHAFYSSHHLRYKHDFKKLEETDSVMKNFCSILQELLRLRQICVHMALVRDSEEGKDGGDLVKMIEEHGISKPRAIQLLALMREAGGSICVECGAEMLPSLTGGGGAGGGGMEDEDVKPKTIASNKKRRTIKSNTTSAACSDAEDSNSIPIPPASSANIDKQSILTKCQHLFCSACFLHHVSPSWPNVKHDDRSTCSVCKTELTTAMDVVQVGAEEFEKLTLEEKTITSGGKNGKNGGGKKGKKEKGNRVFEHSTKTRALIQDLLPFSVTNPASVNFDGNLYDPEDPDYVEKKEEEGGTIGFQPVKGVVVKSVVFSQWTTLLDRLGDALDEVKIKYHRLDGGMNREARNRSMEAFKTEPNVEVLLVSLRAGGVGLNLTAGRRVYLMEPFWNPAVENQAVDRVYRLGQTMPVVTVRFVIQKSIEENMLKIQKRKMDLANMSLRQTLSKAELAKQRMEDLKILMA